MIDNNNPQGLKWGGGSGVGSDFLSACNRGSGRITVLPGLRKVTRGQLRMVSGLEATKRLQKSDDSKVHSRFNLSRSKL